MRHSKLRRRVFTIISICTLMCMISVTVLAGETGEDRYGYNQLKNNIQRELYKGIKNGVANLENPISFYISNTGFTSNDLQLATQMVIADYPEYFWFNGEMSGKIYSDGMVELTTIYTVNGETVTSVEEEAFELTREVQNIIDDIPNDADTDYEIALFLHDQLAQQVSYVFTDNDQTAYGALVEGEAVCAGYARAYQLLLNAAGIEAWTVAGNSWNPNTNTWVAHAWNLMWIENACYYTDVTWDDQSSALFHAFFNRSLAEFASSHAPYTEYAEMLPACDHAANDYFTNEAGEGTGVAGVVTDSTAISDAVDCTKAYQLDGYTRTDVSIWYDGSNISSWLNSYVQNAASAFGMNGCIYGYVAVGNEYQITITSGVGGVYSVTDGIISLDMSYMDAGLTAGTEYELLVAYYTDEGQFVGSGTVQVTIGQYGSAVASAECPRAFDQCKVFVPESGTYVPMVKAITLMEK